jgi:hypothetical protein
MRSAVERLAVTTVAFVLAASSALAQPRSIADPDDSPGPLDIHGGHAAEGGSGRDLFKVRFYDPMRDVLADDRLGAHTFISVEFSSRHRQPLASVCFDVANGTDGIEVRERNPCGSPGSVHTAASARLRSAHVIAVSIPKSALRRARAARWRVASSYERLDDPNCAQPTTPPPEYRYGACRDTTRWAKLP